MVTIIKKGMQRKEIHSLLAEKRKGKKKVVDLKKYCGSIKLKEDPRRLQKLWRNEWQ